MPVNAAASDRPTVTVAEILAAVDPADLDRFCRHLAEAAASWHRRHAADTPAILCAGGRRPELPKAA